MTLYSLLHLVMFDIIPRLEEGQVTSLWRCYHDFDDYQDSNIKYQRRNALLWAAKCGCGTIMHELAHLTADIDMIYAGIHDTLSTYAVVNFTLLEDFTPHPYNPIGLM